LITTDEQLKPAGWSQAREKPASFFEASVTHFVNVNICPWR